jgi:hypothetical protein
MFSSSSDLIGILYPSFTTSSAHENHPRGSQRTCRAIGRTNARWILRTAVRKKQKGNDRSAMSTHQRSLPRTLELLSWRTHIWRMEIGVSSSRLAIVIVRTDTYQDKSSFLFLYDGLSAGKIGGDASRVWFWFFFYEGGMLMVRGLQLLDSCQEKFLNLRYNDTDSASCDFRSALRCTLFPPLLPLAPAFRPQC